MRFLVASLYIEDRTDTDMKIYKVNSFGIKFRAPAGNVWDGRPYGIWMDRSGSIYIIITGSSSGPAGYETFANPHKIAFHV